MKVLELPHTEKVPRKIPRLLWVVLPLAYLVYFYDLSATGLQIGRAHV